MSSRILVALRVPAAPERTFEAFTAEIGAWWKPSPMFAFTLRNPGTLSFEPGHANSWKGGRLIETRPGGKVFKIGKIRAWAPPQSLVFSWRQATFAPGQGAEVEVTFEAIGAETRVTVQHVGWDTAPSDHVAKHTFPEAIFLRRRVEWWQGLLASFKKGVGE